MIRIRAVCFSLFALLFLVSCAALRQVRTDEATLVSVEHVRGHPAMCLVTCVDMVLDYYGCAMRLAHCPGIRYPTNILVVDSLLNAIATPFSDDPYQVRSFILQEDESFLRAQLSRHRPVILIFRLKPDEFHSVVLAGVTADHRHYFIHDPAKKKGQWISRAKLMKRWLSSGNTALLIGLAPAGT